MKNTIRIIAITAFSIILSSSSFCQSDTSIIKFISPAKINLLLGINTGKFTTLEIGTTYNINPNLLEEASTILFLSGEVLIRKDIVVIPKAGVWFSGGASALGLGLNLLYVTDFTKSSIGIRPEIGFGSTPFKFTYGYNFAITNKNFQPMNVHNLSLIFLL
jgi:hypothetical protein